MKLKLNQKYALFFGCLSLLITCIYFVSASHFLQKTTEELQIKINAETLAAYEKYQNNMMRNVARYLSHAIVEPINVNDVGHIDLIIDSLKSGLPILSIVIADKKGEIIAQGTEQRDRIGKTLPFNIDTLKAQRVEISRTHKGYQVLFPVEADGNTGGLGEIVFNRSHINSYLYIQNFAIDTHIANARKSLFLSGATTLLLVFVCTLILSYIFSRILTEPLVRLKESAIRVARGDLDNKILVTRESELGELMRSFNTMIDELQKAKLKRTKHENAGGENIEEGELTP